MSFSSEIVTIHSVVNSAVSGYLGKNLLNWKYTTQKLALDQLTRKSYVLDSWTIKVTEVSVETKIYIT